MITWVCITSLAISSTTESANEAASLKESSASGIFPFLTKFKYYLEGYENGTYFELEQWELWHWVAIVYLPLLWQLYKKRFLLILLRQIIPKIELWKNINFSVRINLFQKASTPIMINPSCFTIRFNWFHSILINFNCFFVICILHICFLNILRVLFARIINVPLNCPLL